MDELLPALDVRLEPGRDLGIAIRAVLGGQVAHLRLEAPPLEQTRHALSIHVEGHGEPIVVLAEPVGFSSEGRFPLRLTPLDDEQRTVLGRLLALSDSLPPPADDSVDPLLGRLLASGKYRLLRLLGTGAAGRVYEAEHVDLAKRVAIKILHPFFAKNAEYVVRFRDEALTASHLDHPNMARTVDFGQERDGTLYFVMELLEGPDLRAALAEGGPFTVERAIAVMAQVAAALAAAHEARVVHRDIKPDNVVLVAGRSDDGSPIELVKVCDFGLAQLQNDGRPGTAGQLAGTPEYMSPEQGRGEVLDARSDIYACGVVLYQLLTGRVPFEAADVRVLLLMHANEPPPRPSDVRPELPVRLDRIVAKCMAKDRDARFATARELRLALLTVLQPGLSEPPSQLEEVVPLGDPRAGFGRFFDAFGATVFDRYKTAPRVLVDAAATLLRNCGELALAVSSAGAVPTLIAISGAGEVGGVAELGGEAAAGALIRLDKRFREARIAAVTFRSGFVEADLIALAPLKGGGGGAASSLLVSVLPAAAVLGPRGALPWVVDLALSRIAHDIATAWTDSKMDPTRKREWRLRIVRDALQSLPKLDDLLIALRSGSLVENAVGASLEGTFAERAFEAMPIGRSVEIGERVLADSSVTLPRSMLVALSRRLATDLTAETEALLRALEGRALIGWADLPPDLQARLRASEGVALLSRDPHRVVAHLSTLDDLAYARELGWIRYALPVVVQRGDAAAARAVAAALVAHRATANEPRAQAIRETLAVLMRPEVMRALAETLLFGEVAQREPARVLLAGQRKGAVDAVVAAADAGTTRSREG